ncbi:hypothetical protein FRC04_010912 [Tulasnella sp. 424]|nr:hypothetical protein FRC04_010912 [Tulasnella sp. 424]KAG8975727.1 hypothetical protein FRC05_005245 [Tulasnella sp. 425]
MSVSPMETYSPLPPPKDEATTPTLYNMDSLPKLPKLVAEDILPLFVLPPSSGDTSVDGVNMGPIDFDRLAYLGRAAIQWVVTTYLFDQDRLSTEEVLHQEVTQPQTWAHWAALYDYFSYLGHGLRESEGARVFSAYVGGLYRQDGIQRIQEWILALIAHMKDTTVLNSPTIAPEDQVAATTQSTGIAGPSSSPGSEPVTLPHASTGYNTPTAPTQTPTQSRKRDREAPTSEDGRWSPSPKRPRVSPSQTHPVERPTISGSSSPRVHPTATTPAPGVVIGHIMPMNFTSADFLPVGSSRASSSSAATQQDTKPNLDASQPQKKWMSVLNEGCMSTKVEWKMDTESEGADHIKTWIATLTVPKLGIFTIGEGKTKKLAQEEAARQACERLNWTQDYKW